MSDLKEIHRVRTEILRNFEEVEVNRRTLKLDREDWKTWMDGESLSRLTDSEGDWEKVRLKESEKSEIKEMGMERTV